MAQGFKSIAGVLFQGKEEKSEDAPLMLFPSVSSSPCLDWTCKCVAYVSSMILVNFGGLLFLMTPFLS